MTESFSSESVPAELLEISRAIESRRGALESEHGVIEEKHIVHHVVGEELFEKSASTLAVPSPGSHYLDFLDNESLTALNSYIARISELGLKKTVVLVRNENPFLIDAFHDALTDKLYGELKRHGLIS